MNYGGQKTSINWAVSGIQERALPENVETKIIVPMESNKKVKIKKLTTILPEDNVKLRLRNYKKID